jgi:hypothetical protein
MKAMVFRGVNKPLQLETVPDPTPGLEEVQGDGGASRPQRLGIAGVPRITDAEIDWRH